MHPEVSLPLTQEDLVEIKQRYFYIHELQTFQQYGVLLAKRLFTFQLVVSCMLSVLSYCYFNVYYWIFSLCIVCGSVIMRLSILIKHPRFFWIFFTGITIASCGFAYIFFHIVYGILRKRFIHLLLLLFTCVYSLVVTASLYIAIKMYSFYSLVPASVLPQL